jgi:integrase
VNRNAATLVDGPKVKRHQVEPLTEEQACRLLNTFSGHRLEALYRVAPGSGLRRGEIISLRWSDVNFEQRTLKVRKSKTDAGVRTLTFPASLIDALRAHWSFQLQERLAQGLNWKEHGLVFLSERGTPLSGRNLVRHFK